MRTISSKGDIKDIWKVCSINYDQENIAVLVNIIHAQILSQRVKFPLLEYCAEELYTILHERNQIPFCDAIENLKTEGGNIILGKLLQQRLYFYFDQTIEKAVEYIAKANAWYVADIIGERVFGYALLHDPKPMLRKFKELSNHPSNWVIRSLGAGGHFAIKKGMNRSYATSLFSVYLSMANSKDKEIRQGVGWAAKTTAKFHPEIIVQFQSEIANPKIAGDWFRKKVQIGLTRNTYAKRDRSKIDSE
jgi:hypothetical protein